MSICTGPRHSSIRSFGASRTTEKAAAVAGSCSSDSGTSNACARSCWAAATASSSVSVSGAALPPSRVEVGSGGGPKCSTGTRLRGRPRYLRRAPHVSRAKRVSTISVSAFASCLCVAASWRNKAALISSTQLSVAALSGRGAPGPASAATGTAGAPSRVESRAAGATGVAGVAGAAEAAGTGAGTSAAPATNASTSSRNPEQRAPAPKRHSAPAAAAAPCDAPVSTPGSHATTSPRITTVSAAGSTPSCRTDSPRRNSRTAACRASSSRERASRWRSASTPASVSATLGHGPFAAKPPPPSDTWTVKRSGVGRRVRPGPSSALEQPRGPPCASGRAPRAVGGQLCRCRDDELDRATTRLCHRPRSSCTLGWARVARGRGESGGGAGQCPAPFA
eukprot:scaffold127958_cov57-Phaeocystis_antarctica.AAC.4